MKGIGNRPWGMILLGVYLILVGLGIFGVVIPSVVTGVIVLAAGILILLPLVRM